MTKEDAKQWIVKQKQSGDTISREETLTAFADYVGSGMSMDDYDALWNIVAKTPPVNPIGPILDKIRAEIDNALSDGMVHKKTVLGIIDKYKAESEE